MAEMFVESLRNRIRAMNTLYERAASDLTAGQVNHHERTGVLPMAFSFLHFMRIQDQAVGRSFLGEGPLWLADDWAKRMGAGIDAVGREETVEEMEHQSVADMDAYREYQAAVIERTARALDAIDEEALAEVVLPALPPNMQNIYCAIVVGPGNPIRKLEVLECFVYQHGLRHMGEIEHGRALVGLGGMTS